MNYKPGELGYFVGTFEQFCINCVHGGGMNNFVQSKIVAKARKEWIEKNNGKFISQRSGKEVSKGGDLQAGHKNEGKGGGRIEIAEKIFYEIGVKQPNGNYKIDLAIFFNKFYEAHQPLEKHIEFITRKENMEDAKKVKKEIRDFNKTVLNKKTKNNTISEFKKFESWMKNIGLSLSTISSYLTAIRKVLEWEKIDIEQLIWQINKLVMDYDTNGIKETQGKWGHNTVKCALKKIKEFVDNN